jgi:O-acetyl-ADP-ribose deacetylase (regulator of RNase III)
LTLTGEPGSLRVLLSAPDEALARAWIRWCGDLDFVSVHRESITDLRCDAVVSPANSFGFMDGGIDAFYTRHFGPGVQDRLQRLIRERHHGELTVGTAEIVETGDRRIPWLIAAPTMRVPMILGHTVNAYLAARATLLLAVHGRFPEGKREGRPVAEAVRAVAFPGLGTGVGRVAPDVCARQMRAALDDVLGRSTFPGSWWEAQVRHQRLTASDIRDLQLPPDDPS